MDFVVDILCRAAPKGVLQERALKKVFSAPSRIGFGTGMLAGLNS